LTDMRIDVVKAALKLTPDQEKYWPDSRPREESASPLRRHRKAGG